MITLTEDAYGYEAGTTLRDVPLREAREWECNRCGDCCDSSAEGVKKDEETGLPLLVWGDEIFPLPEDLYESRFGHPMLKPVKRGDGELTCGVSYDDFERDADDKPHQSFSCVFLQGEDGDEERTCGIWDQEEPRRPYKCGSFPIFGEETDIAVLNQGWYIPPTGATPRCTWYGIRVTGPWKETEKWRREHAKHVAANPTLRG